MKSTSAIHPAITENMEDSLVKRLPYILMHESRSIYTGESRNTSISAMSNSLNQARAHSRPTAHAWFTKIVSGKVCVCTYRGLRTIFTSSFRPMIWRAKINQSNDNGTDLKPVVGVWLAKYGTWYDWPKLEMTTVTQSTISTYHCPYALTHVSKPF